ncbi:response regulator, partial [bacterium]|nr:response regulator [bacterium]
MAYILVMEDERIIQTIIRRYLEREGHEVVIAGDGEEGIKLYNERPADLVLTDIIMPKKEGIETIRDLKKISPDVKIIAMSGGG